MKRNAEAEDLYDSTNLDMKLTEAHYNRSLGYLKVGELELATEAAQAALEINQGFPLIHSLLELIKQEYFTYGLTSIKENKISDGIRAFKSAIAIDPTFKEAYSELVSLYLNQDELEAAERTAKKILQFDSGSEVAHEFLEKIKCAYCIRGHADLRRNRLARAKTTVNKVLRLDPNYESAHELSEKIKRAYYDQGITFFKRNQYNKAIPSFEGALTIDPDFTEAHCGIVRSYLYGGALASAEGVIRERLDTKYRLARDLLVEIKDAYYNFGILCLRQGKFREAEKAIKEVSRLDSSGESLLKMKDMYCDQGRAYLKHSEFEFAEKTVRTVLWIDAGYKSAYKLLEDIKYAYYDRDSPLGTICL